MTEAAWLYAGRVAHLRHTPFRHRFDYRIWMMALDLDRTREIAGCWFGHNRFGLLSLYDRDHGARDGTALRGYVTAALAQAGLPAPARIVFVFIPRLLGYAFNPIGFYFCHDGAGRLFAVLHQVKNTFGGQIGYVMPVTGDRPIRQAAPKRMHVSPFFDMAGGYRFWLTPPVETLAVSIQYATLTEKRLTATMILRKRPWTRLSLSRLLLEMPLAPVKVMTAILWQALRLRLAGARYHPAPQRGHEAVVAGEAR